MSDRAILREVLEAPSPRSSQAQKCKTQRPNPEGIPALEPVEFGKHPGHPSTYRDEFADQAYKYCLLGATNEELAMVFGCPMKSIRTWLATRPAFRDAVYKGRDFADANVAYGLYRRAVGFEHTIMTSVLDKDGNVVEVPETKYYPPDPKAAMHWLAVRRQGAWKLKDESSTVNINQAPTIIINPIKSGQPQKIIDSEPVEENTAA